MRSAARQARHPSSGRRPPPSSSRHFFAFTFAFAFVHPSVIMSWLWSSAPPSDELDSSPGREDISFDPYASSSGTAGDFGTAFGDDFDGSSSNPAPSDSFDIYAAPSGPSFETDSSYTTPSLDTSAFPSDASASAAPAIDFGSMGRINPSVLSPRAALRTPRSADGVDYVFAEDYRQFRKKSGTEQLTYLAGSSYLTGAVIGGSRGFYDAMRASAGKGAKLKLNAVLNGAGKRGAALANTFGALALAFSLSESALYNYTSDETLGNYAAAGAAAGALFKSTRGPRTAAVWAAAGAVTALGTVWASREGYYGRGLQGIL